jgi:hypothetical protein
MLPDTQRQLINWMMHRGEVSLPQVAAYCHESDDGARRLLHRLVEQGLLRERRVHGVPHYRARLRPKRRSQLAQDVWQSLEEPNKRSARTIPATCQQGENTPSSATSGKCCERARPLCLSVAPMALAFLLRVAAGDQWGFLSHILGFLGVVTVSLVAGVFPILCWPPAAARGVCARGDLPGSRLSLGGNKLYLFFLANLFCMAC